MIFPTLHLNIERWKFNKEYGVYVSTLGNFKDRHKRALPIKLSNGYCYVTTETSDWKAAHRLVMLTWCPIPNAEELTVDHLNHNKRDNSVRNLEWVTEEENLRRAKEDTLNPKKKKKKNPAPTNISILEQEKAEKKIAYAKSILGYSIDGEGCYSKQETIERLVAMRGENSRKLTKRALHHLENGVNQEGRKVFGKKSVKHVVQVIYKEENENV